MTERDQPERRDHRFSEGEGFEEPYEGFDFDPPELDVDPSTVDPVDSRVVTDTLDERNVRAEDVDSDALLDVGLNYMGINRFEQAADAFERAARYADTENEEQEAWVNKGVAHGQMEEWDDAIGAYREALYVDSDGEFAAEAETNLAYALWEFGEDEEAFEHAENAVRVDDRLPHAWYNLGYIQNERGQHEDALECFDNAIRLGFRQADVYEEKTRALDELGREEEAEEARKQAEEMRQQQEERLVDQ
ncbi:tetratricopeptide repeat protein [Halocalculus aciditolerans]|uniref:Tetratricopeptide repeat protein n=1 Tax=Halocalculus aciditolerans TaxID=1383812 RepID=A0A830FEB4_9EURY|nr:tetratricopeptide repeat protein [Halocalculus aciditolerans]GGL46891.1 hypothetical protein GCM10009039_01450 [Halocalculus aciditolerans]